MEGGTTAEIVWAPVIAVLATFAALLGLGAHTVVPARLAGSAAEGPRRRWALAALPLLAAALVAVLVWLRDQPDPLLGVSWGSDPLTTFAGRSALLLVTALAVGDLLALWAYRRLEAAGWRLLAVAAVPALLAGSLFLEIVRVGHGPRTTAGALALATLCRTASALGTGEALAPGQRPLWTVPAGLILPSYPLALPPAVREMLVAEGGLLTLGAAALLFLTARWLPARLWRPAVLAAAVLAALAFAQTTALAGRFPVYMEPLPAL